MPGVATNADLPNTYWDEVQQATQAGVAVQGVSPTFAPVTSSAILVGPPPSGTWKTNQSYVDSNGVIWVCGTGGSPGTNWFQGGSGVELAYADLSSDPAAATTAIADVSGLSITFTAPARAFKVQARFPLVSVSASGNGLALAITDSSNVTVDQITAIGAAFSGSFYVSGLFAQARLPRTGGANAYAITPGTSYTFKVRQVATAGTGNILSNAGLYRPSLTAVTC